MANLFTLFGLVILGYLVLYFRGRRYLEKFEDGSNEDSSSSTTDATAGSGSTSTSATTGSGSTSANRVTPNIVSPTGATGSTKGRGNGKDKDWEGDWGGGRNTSNKNWDKTGGAPLTKSSSESKNSGDVKYNPFFYGRYFYENKMAYPPEKPYTMNPIDDIDDYEVSSVFQNQGSKEASKKQISDAMTRYPLDWSAQPPDSQYFQSNQAQFEKQVINDLNNPPDTSMYNEIDGSDMTPPNTQAVDDEERKILQTYVPESSKGLLSYSVDDVKGLLEKIYYKKGKIPVIEKSKQGENVWEIVEVKDKDPHIVWEDEIEKQTQREKMDKRGEEIIQVPYTVTDVAAGLDPFFQARNSVRDGKFDYNQWTPGLERMFAPTYPIKYWF